MNKLEKIIAQLPHSPGVYLYQNAAGELIYVGKAKDLKKRVSSYFNKKDLDPKTEHLVSKIANISSLVTNSEAEALLLEDSLIKKHKPKYNIDLKDDKRYPYFRLETKAEYPVLKIVRQRKKDGAKYFGPFSGSITDTLKIINKLFRLRKCKQLNPRACLYNQLGQCLAPCLTKDKSAYQKEVLNLVRFLEGDYQTVLAELKTEMNDFAKAEQFEKAAETRDKIEYLERIKEKQTVVSPDLKRRDVWSFAQNNSFAAALVMIMQNGRIVGSQSFSVRTGNQDASFKERALINFYKEAELPEELILPPDLEISALEKYFEQTRIQQPRQGFRAELLKLARKNVLKSIQEKALSELKQNKETLRLQAAKTALALPSLPLRIDCFDISNLQGKDTVAAMTVLRNGLPDKREYRRYHLEQDAPNDYAAMEEVLNRRYYKVMTGEAESPDLIIVDGGKGQLNIADQVLKKFNLQIPLIGLAKKNEEIFVPRRLNPIVLKRSNPALQLIQLVRDEAHRFAVSFHQHKRGKRIFASALDEIVGLGEKTKIKLLQKYGSVENIKKQNREDLLKILNRKQAAAVVEYFSGGDPD